LNRSLCTLNAEIESLPAFTASKSEWPASETSDPCDARRSDPVSGAAAPPFPG
jgi:hypothetical protein